MRLGVQVQNNGVTKNVCNEICHETGKLTKVTFRHEGVIQISVLEILTKNIFSMKNEKIETLILEKKTIFDFEIVFQNFQNKIFMGKHAN